MGIRWIALKTSSGHEVVCNLAHCARVEMGDKQSAALLALQNGELKGVCSRNGNYRTLEWG